MRMAQWLLIKSYILSAVSDLLKYMQEVLALRSSYSLNILDCSAMSLRKMILNENKGRGDSYRKENKTVWPKNIQQNGKHKSNNKRSTPIYNACNGHFKVKKVKTILLMRNGNILILAVATFRGSNNSDTISEGMGPRPRS